MKAFPTNIKVATGGDGWRTDYGMDLRDYFAAKAMQGFFASGYYEGETDITALAKNAYLVANAMMEARK